MRLHPAAKEVAALPYASFSMTLMFMLEPSVRFSGTMLKVEVDGRGAAGVTTTSRRLLAIPDMVGADALNV